MDLSKKINQKVTFFLPYKGALNIIKLSYINGLDLRNTDKKIIANYIGWRVAMNTMRYLDTKARKIRYQFNKAVYGLQKPYPRYFKIMYSDQLYIKLYNILGGRLVCMI